MVDEAEFVELVRRNPVNAELLRRLSQVGLQDCWLVAGCLFQTVWNVRSCREPTHGIRDYDVFYFDASDLSWEAEDRMIKSASAHFEDLGVEVQLRNQARVHLWYEAKFGGSYPPLRSSCDGIDRFLIAGTCVGLRSVQEGFEVHAPFGTDEITSGQLRPNSNNRRPELFAAKAASYIARWPWLRAEMNLI